MWPLGWALLQHDWYPYKIKTHTHRRPCEESEEWMASEANSAKTFFILDFWPPEL